MPGRGTPRGTPSKTHQSPGSQSSGRACPTHHRQSTGSRLRSRAGKRVPLAEFRRASNHPIAVDGSCLCGQTKKGAFGELSPASFLKSCFKRRPRPNLWHSLPQQVTVKGLSIFSATAWRWPGSSDGAKPGEIPTRKSYSERFGGYFGRNK